MYKEVYQKYTHTDVTKIIDAIKKFAAGFYWKHMRGSQYFFNAETDDGMLI